MITVTISSFKEIIFSKGEAAFLCVAYGAGCIRSVRAVSVAVVVLDRAVVGRAVVGRTVVGRAVIGSAVVGRAVLGCGVTVAGGDGVL